MNFIAFDLETTGIHPQQDYIVEIGAVRFENNKPVASFGVLINPGVPIPLDASAVNGITDDMVRDKPRVDAVLPDFAAFCGDLPLVAHNAPFDYKFLLQAINRHKAVAPGGVVLDTLPLARKVFPGLFNYKLGTLVRHLQIPNGTFHRAEEDSAYCGFVFVNILTTLDQRRQPCGIADLVNMTGKPEARFPQFAVQPGQLDLF